MYRSKPQSGRDSCFQGVRRLSALQANLASENSPICSPYALRKYQHTLALFRMRQRHCTRHQVMVSVTSCRGSCGQLFVRDRLSKAGRKVRRWVPTKHLATCDGGAPPLRPSGTRMYAAYWSPANLALANRVVRRRRILSSAELLWAMRNLPTGIYSAAPSQYRIGRQAFVCGRE